MIIGTGLDDSIFIISCCGTMPVRCINSDVASWTGHHASVIYVQIVRDSTLLALRINIQAHINAHHTILYTILANPNSISILIIRHNCSLETLTVAYALFLSIDHKPSHAFYALLFLPIQNTLLAILLTISAHLIDYYHNLGWTVCCIHA